MRRRPISALAFALALALAATAAAEREHTVRPGQSLNRIARRYNVDVRELARANDLRVTANLRPGQVLRIPERGYHYVRTGETLSSIARLRENKFKPTSKRLVVKRSDMMIRTFHFLRRIPRGIRHILLPR
ncbi:MAG: LysM domain-containing protein, partial [Myxococcota bacterium]